ncbi:thioredoxin [Olsenella sp. Marseille-P4559]|uniref:thioredoxin n=1 Tax=Olsenella sp. Marseille-P4559 TaxID=2364795 RepID=UPI00102F86A0|nr:thioredoxin [Olsenella sp. Marseille-P4559]
MEYQFTSRNFQQEVLDSKQPVLVDFYANWCGPCRSMMPTIAQLADEYNGRVKVGKVNSDEEPELARQFGVMSIPAFFILKDGKIVDQMVGAMPKPALEQRLNAQL